MLNASILEFLNAAAVAHGYPWRDLYAPANIPNWFLFAAAIWAGWMALRTLRAIRKQADAQMNADRAWVLASIAGQPEEPLIGNLKKGTIPGIVWRIQVFGTTPARIIREDYRCRIVSGNAANVFTPMLESPPAYLSRPTFPDSDVMLPPGEKNVVTVFLENATNMKLEDEIAQVVTGFKFLCSYGRIEYEDAFGRKGITQFCAIYKPPVGGELKSPDGTVLNPPGFRIDGPLGYNFNT